MRKYLAILRVRLGERIAYRGAVLFGLLCFALPALATALLWHALYGAGAGPEEYRLAEIVTYSVLIRFVAEVVKSDLFWSVRSDLLSGALSQRLLLPAGYFGYQLAGQAAGRLAAAAMAAVACAGVYLAAGRWLEGPASTGHFALMLLALPTTFLLQFMIQFVLAMISFWVEDSNGIYFTVYHAIDLLSGMWTPLDLYPDGFLAAAAYTPAPYLASFPVRIYLGRLTPGEAAAGLALQVVWIAAIAVLAAWVWSRGTRHFQAAGG